MAHIACFGEVLLRLAPQGGVSLRRANGLDVHVGGAEANVAVGLAQLGHRVRMVSILPESTLGDIARRRLATEALDLAFVGTGPGRMGLYFHEPAAGPRGGAVIYDRAGSAFARAGAGDFDIPAALAGVGHVHLSGISPAVSEAAADMTLALAQAARAQGATVSFDGNFRASLWQASGRDPRNVLAPIVVQVDLLFGDSRDAGLLLGRDFAGENPSVVAAAMFAAFPALAAIAHTRREVEAGGVQFLGARMDTPDRFEEIDERAIGQVVERIGSGDAFAAGVLHRWLADAADLAGALDAGLSLALLKHAMPGDLPDFSVGDLGGECGDIRR